MSLFLPIRRGESTVDVRLIFDFLRNMGDSYSESQLDRSFLLTYIAGGLTKFALTGSSNIFNLL